MVVNYSQTVSIGYKTAFYIYPMRRVDMDLFVQVQFLLKLLKRPENLSWGASALGILHTVVGWGMHSEF